MSSSSGEENDAGAPLPDFTAKNIQIQTVAPALGVLRPPGSPGRAAAPDYLDYDPKGRGMIVTMFGNAGTAYLMGIGVGGTYGFRQGLISTPSNRLRIQVNSILNHCGRYGSRAGNTLGVYAILYSFYEGMADHYDLEDRLGVRAISPTAASFCAPGLGAFLAGATYFSSSGIRVAALGGTLSLGAAAATYAGYTVLGIPYGSRGFLFF